MSQGTATQQGGSKPQFPSTSTIQNTPSIPNMPNLPTLPQNIEQAMESGSRVNQYLTDYAMASVSLDRSRSSVGSPNNIVKLEATRIMEQSMDPIPKWRQVSLLFLKNHKCYELMPVSGKVVIFDSELPVKHAFRALTEHDIKCAPVWSSMKSDFIGFMTVTDFTDILHHYSQDLQSYQRKINDLERRTVGSWCTFRKKHKKAKIKKKFVSVTADDSIFDAMDLLLKYCIHRMPVRKQDDSQSILCVLNYQKILRFLMQKLSNFRESMPITISDLNLNFQETYKNYPHLTYKSSLIEAVTLLSESPQYTAIPIVDDKGKVIDGFLRSDIRFFARNEYYMKLNTTIEEFLRKFKNYRFVCSCQLGSKLFDVLLIMLKHRCQVSFILDPKQHKLIGMINTLDICSIIANGTLACDMKNVNSNNGNMDTNIESNIESNGQNDENKNDASLDSKMEKNGIEFENENKMDIGNSNANNNANNNANSKANRKGNNKNDNSKQDNKNNSNDIIAAVNNLNLANNCATDTIS